MQDLEFPLLKIKSDKHSGTFNLSDPEQRKKYFDLKVGKEIKEIQDFLKDHTFIAYLMGKKGAGKGTYAKLVQEIFGSDKIAHFSVGDAVREIEQEFLDPERKATIFKFLEKNYRGFISLEKAISALENRSTKTLLPTEMILALVKMKIAEMGKKTLLIDGFPRNLDQISHSLFFRELIDYRGDPDIFILIDIPESIINERIKTRVVCPHCHTSRNLRLLPTKNVGYDKEKKTFYLMCDNPECNNAKMFAKEGDELGIEPIKKRLALDEGLLKMAHNLYGIPKVLLRNHVPVEKVNDYFDDYEITPEYSFQWDEEKGKVKINKKQFTVLDDNGKTCYSLLAPATVVSLIKQLASIFNLLDK